MPRRASNVAGERVTQERRGNTGGRRGRAVPSGVSGPPTSQPSPPTPEAVGGHPRRWLILGVLVVSLLIVVLDNSVLNVALREISDPGRGLGATQSELQWAVNAYTLVFAGMLFTWGVLGDRVGRRRILLIGFVLFGLASVACAYAQSPGQLIAARAGLGFGGAAVLPSTLAIISNVFDPRERPKAIGIWAGAVGLAIAIGPIVGGLLLESFWWGSVFLINLPIVLLGLLAVVVVVPESRNPRPERLDPVGVLLQMAGLVLLVYGIIRVGDAGTLADLLALGSAAAGAAVLAAFVVWEARMSSPALDVRLFRDPRFSAAVAAIGLVFFALLGVTFFMVFYLQVVRGYTPLQAGVLLLPLALGQLIFSPLSARSVARFGPRAVCTTGMLLVSVSFVCFLLLDVDSPIWVLQVSFFLQGAAMGNVMPPATEAVMAALPREKAGVGSAVNNTVRQVGGALGVAVLGTLLSAVYRRGAEESLAPLPVPSAVKEEMAESVQATVAVLDRLGGPTAALRATAYDAFVDAMHVTALCAAGVALLGALVVLRWFPRRTGQAPTDQRVGRHRARAAA